VLLHNTECKARLAVTLPVSRIFFSTARQWFTRSLHKTQLKVTSLLCRVKALGRGGFTRIRAPKQGRKSCSKSFTEHKRPASIFLFFFFFLWCPVDTRWVPTGKTKNRVIRKKMECPRESQTRDGKFGTGLSVGPFTWIGQFKISNLRGRLTCSWNVL
jgi:hypothetical protein